MALDELANHKRPLTHHPGSQGWGIRCPTLVCVCVLATYVCGHGGGVCGAGLAHGAGVGTF